MKTLMIRTATVLALTAIAGPAMADLKAEVRLSDLQFTLTDLRPDDGVEPMMTWLPLSDDPDEAQYGPTTEARADLSRFGVDPLVSYKHAPGALSPMQASLTRDGSSATAQWSQAGMVVMASTQGKRSATATLDVDQYWVP